jgi:flagellar motor switch protein FliM
MSTASNSQLDTGEADYFSAILALQNAKQQSSALPQALFEAIGLFQQGFQTEGVAPVWPKPQMLSAAEIVSYGLAPDITTFERRDEGARMIVAFNPAAAIAVATLLLGGKPTLSKRLPSGIETRIAQDFIQVLHPDFKPVVAPQTSIIWQDFSAAKLPFDDSPNSAFVLIMINRRGEAASVSAAQPQDIQQQLHLKRALNNGIMNVDYVLNGGDIALEMLRNLKVGSELPLTALSDQPLEARANGQVIFSGVLNLSPERMRFGVTQILAESRND